jgi:protein-glutamine gamma-glutamyltransferase
MRFGLVHRVMTSTLAVLGILALVSSGELSRWVNTSIIVGLVASLAIPESMQGKPWVARLSTFGPILLLVVQLTRGFLGRPILELAVEFAAGLQIIRLATRRGAAHDQQVVVLALLHLIAGTVLGGGLTYGLCFLGFLVVAPGALVLSHLRREVEGNYRQGARDRTGLPVDVPRILRSRRVVGRPFLAVTCLLSVPILLFTGALFLVFPRVGLSLLLLNRQPPGRLVGFSDQVDLGKVGVIRNDPTIALRVEVPDLPKPPPERLTMYLRGTAFDRYDGRAWKRTITRRVPVASGSRMVVIERMPIVGQDRLMKINLEPISPSVIFVPPNSVSMEVRMRTEMLGNSSLTIEQGPEGEFRYSGGDERGIRYVMYMSQHKVAPMFRMGEHEKKRYLTTPNFPKRIENLAKEWTKGAKTDLEKAKLIETQLRTKYRYDLGSPSGKAKSPLDHFLFESKRGHCEYYSTAMAMMLRRLNIPTRNVTGFVGGSYNRFGRYYAVRQGDAHSWVEVYLDGQGWVTFDPTPPADAQPQSEIRGIFALFRDIIEATSQRWDTNVVGYNLNQQLSLVESIRRTFHFKSGHFKKSRQIWMIYIGATAAAIVVAFLVRWALRRKKLSRHFKRDDHEKHQAALLATALYESLEAALVVQGIGRPQGVPPLRHAMGHSVQEHIMAAEIVELTQIYQNVRFGGDVLSPEEQKDFERRVRLIRTSKNQKAIPQPPSPPVPA